ncbi:hypothetical protein K504DRAFT_486061 [Pleomassaria siparia CBS 279.74]|uniref:Mid2 domain-containing protein n=1 Tax=Pleomassaria siparia CBS 279.74 TaxID=1314801 RepID=A0A6G1JS60_9PLEO|nr:hypothetical protein K504DRAFT_486061 [Pleomassaria siparia CBS 279.74]
MVSFSVTLVALVWSLGQVAMVGASSIATYNETKCMKGLENMNGPNGYPEGICTLLPLKSFQAFQIQGLDPGCGVTLYGEDTTSDPCSSDVKILGKIATCYNATWVYYSIDGCDIPSITPSPTSISLPSSTSLPISSSPASSSTSSSGSASSPSATPAPAASSNRLSLIIGASIGGVGAVALMAMAALLFVRHRRSRSNTAPPVPPAYELPNDRGVLEAPRGEKTIPKELWAHDPVQEMGRNSVHIPPVELAGDDGSAGEQDKKNMAPLTKAHMSSRDYE